MEGIAADVLNPLTNKMDEICFLKMYLKCLPKISPVSFHISEPKSPLPGGIGGPLVW
jgi:hypothetical protein